ncbi:hypothetical protein VTJ83DRAFT_857 [Remersonia thermophila]|uniref:Na+/H+ antiporter n=1 Tax=Remersonia thermophila TaxID=72144 RepID=A0ABR4DMC3_9PEZI
MVWDHLSITKPHLAYIILGGFTSLFMLCSSVFKERMYIGEATVATLCGVIFGPHAANLINPLAWGGVDIITIEFSRIVLVVQCFAVGVELPKFYMEKHWKSVTFLLVPVMVFGWLITSLFVWWLVEPLNFLESLVVAACVTATDPVLASSVVGKGKFARRVPKHLRDLLSAESGCNDGMAFPFIYLALYLIHDKQSARDVSFHWIVYTILYECVFGAIFGFIVGYIARHAVKYAERHDMIDRESFLAFYFALALFCAGAGSILGIDDLLVGFAAGVGFSNDGWFSEKTEESHVSNVIDLLFNLTYFVYFGTIIPWKDFNNAVLGLQAWRLAVLAIFVILFRRIPIMMLLKPVIPDIKTWREALFAGHFGPIGVGAIFIAILARSELETEHPIPLAELPPPDHEHYKAIALVWPIVCFLVVASIIVHGSSIAVFTLGKHINTLTITMSYTHGTEDGPGWMHRLPRISSHLSRSEAKTSEADGDEPKMPEYPPGTLPPLGFPGNLLRRVREDESSSPGSRSSSLAPRRQRKKWDDGIGPGGPISQSAIFPQSRTHVEPQTPETPRVSTEPASADEGSTPPVSTAPVTQPPKSSPEATAQMAAIEHALPSLRLQRTRSLEVYQEGNKIVLENQDGDVLAVQPVRGRSDSGAAKTNPLADELKTEAGPSGWTYASLKQKVAKWREAEIEKRKEKKQLSKSEPARAFQFGNTIIVENEDGEVLKKYDLPTQKPQPDLVSQGLRYMGMGVFAKALEKSPGEASQTGDGAGESSTVARPRRRTTVTGHNDEDEDKNLRFTIGGIGRRMTKKDFLDEMRKLDNKLSVSGRPRAGSKPQATSASQDNGSSSVPPKAAAPSNNAAAMSGATQPTSSSSASPAVGDLLSPGPDPSKGRDAKKSEGSRSTSNNRDNEQAETEAERRRREAALGIGSQGEDSDDDDTPRVPPPRKAAIRFADMSWKGKGGDRSGK